MTLIRLEKALLVLVEKDIVIQDACIFFDLIDLGLIESFFELGLKVITCPQVIAEITNPDQMDLTNIFIERGSLLVDKNGDLSEIQKIFDANSGLSLTDSTVLELAIRRKGTVLSSDLSLRKATKKSGLNVRGVLWIIDELVKGQIISEELAVKSLKLYLEINNRAPKNAIVDMINRLI